MKNVCYISIFLMSISLYSCGAELSNLNQITANDLTCDVNQSKAQEYYEKYGKNHSNIRADDQLKQKSFEKLSNIPEAYLEFVIDKHKTPMYLYYSNGGGETQLQPYGNTMYPLWLKSDLYVLAHEFGHASEGYNWGRYGSNFRKDLADISSLIAQKYQSKVGWYLRSYAGSNRWYRDRETFAELFDTWYCSEAARNLIKKGMPEVYEFAQKYLIDPDGFIGSRTPKNVNIIVNNKGANSRIYFSNNNNYSNISYCISESSDYCTDRHSVSEFTNKRGAENLFVSDTINLSRASSFVLFIYGDNDLVRKVSISK